MKTPKRKLKPSWETYNRILWDPKLNQLAFYIGYEDRMIKNAFGEKLLVDWADNDIPWNRVQYIRCADTIVWDRVKRLDLFEDNLLPQEAFVLKKNPIKNSIVIEGISIVNKPVFCINNHQATPVIETPNYLLEELKVISFNLLTDKYSSESVQTAQRVPSILSYLLEIDADILLLQEVDAPVLKQLLQANWGHLLYSSDFKRQTGNYYQELVILSKYPFLLMEYQYSAQKKFPIASWQINGQSVHIANVHLSSNRAKNASTIRDEQLHILLKYLNKLQGTVLIGGDFNTREQDESQWLNTFSFIDTWSQLHPDDKGYTFDPNNNPLAHQSTLTGLPARFDRIYLREKNRAWGITSSAIFANKALVENPQLFPSDHYGLVTTFQQKNIHNQVEAEPIGNWNDVLATYHSAIVLIPTGVVGDTIQHIRQQFDRKHQRWMPHITLLYGFLPDRYFDEAAKELVSVLKELNTFELVLKQYQFFSQQSETTAWLEPIETGNNRMLQQLQEQLNQMFFMKNFILNKKHSFAPHISVGQFPSIEAAKLALPTWEELSFDVNKIALISRHNQAPFMVHYTIELGTGKIDIVNKGRVIEQELIQLFKTRNLLVSKKQQTNSKVVLELIEATCSVILGEHTLLYPLGSTALGTNLTNSDVDVLCPVPIHVEPLVFLKKVKIELQGYYEEARLVADAKVPILKLKIEHTLIDLLCVEYPSSFISIKELSVKHRRYFNPQNWQAVSGIIEVQSILKHIHGRLSLDSFQWLVKIIKYWAIQRSIKGNAFGFLGSYSWTILAVWVVQQIPEKEDTEDLTVLLTYFFDLLITYDWKIPLSIVNEHSYKNRGKQDRMAILTSIKPYYNSARNITYSTAQIIQQELQRGKVIIKQLKNGNASWAVLFQKVTVPSESNLVLLLNSSSNNNLQEACGWIEGHIVSLIISIEQFNPIVVRPYPSIEQQMTSATINLDFQGLEDQLFNAVKSCIMEFIASFDFDNQHSSLTYRLIQYRIE